MDGYYTHIVIPFIFQKDCVLKIFILQVTDYICHYINIIPEVITGFKYIMSITNTFSYFTYLGNPLPWNLSDCPLWSLFWHSWCIFVQFCNGSEQSDSHSIVCWLSVSICCLLLYSLRASDWLWAAASFSCTVTVGSEPTPVWFY